MQSLSALSLSGTWVLSRQASKQPHSDAITALALPILAACDVIICLTLTCTIIPLYFLGINHLKNTAGSIVVLAQSLFFLISFPCKFQIPNFDYKLPYLNNEKTVWKKLLQDDCYDAIQIKELCEIGTKNPIFKLLFELWDPAFASGINKNQRFNATFQDFIAKHPKIHKEKQKLARKLILIAKQEAEVHVNYIVKNGLEEWFEIICECNYDLTLIEYNSLDNLFNFPSALAIISKLSKINSDLLINFLTKSIEKFNCKNIESFLKTKIILNKISNDRIVTAIFGLSTVEKYKTVVKLFKKHKCDIYVPKRMSNKLFSFLNSNILIIKHLLLFPEVLQDDIVSLSESQKEICINKSFHLELKFFIFFLKNGNFSDETIEKFLKNLIIKLDNNDIEFDQNYIPFKIAAIMINKLQNITIPEEIKNPESLMNCFSQINCWKIVIALNLFIRKKFEHFDQPRAWPSEIMTDLKNKLRLLYLEQDFYNNLMAKATYEIVLDYLAPRMFDPPALPKIEVSEELDKN